MESTQAKELIQQIFDNGFNLGVRTTIRALELSKKEYLETSTHNNLIQAAVVHTFDAIINGIEKGLAECPPSTPSPPQPLSNSFS